MQSMKLFFSGLRLSRFFRPVLKMDNDGEKTVHINIAIKKIVIQGYPLF